MTNNQLNIMNLVMMQIQSGQPVDETQLNNYVDTFKIINPISDIEKEEIIRELHSKLVIKLERGTCLKEKEHVSWYYAAKGEINPVFWKRYAVYLTRNFSLSKKVINSIDTITDEIMDMCGNPREDNPFVRRGLIIGDVQSGKTSTYTALINKAADAGYKIVILLTGVIEKLRQQTQERLDNGFVGIDSTAKLNDRNDINTGVGIFDKNTSAISLTSVGGDFNSTIARQFVTRLKSFKDPVLFVLKKNKNILENLESWLRHSIISGDDKIKAPLLLIDDESDYGSVNTKVDDSSRINACIRKLLKSFNQSTYVAVTATPYANIFIDPDSTDEMLSDDLFPKDFIYALEAPSNYIGARSIFPEDSRYNYMLKNNDDCEEYIPQKHKKDFVVRDIPPTLKEAIACFFIVNTIRDLRKQTKTHRSMLVNVSRFIEVQNHICEIINDYVRDLQLEVSNYSLLGNKALEHEGIAFLKAMYEKHFKHLTEEQLNGESIYTWSEIQQALNKAVAPIVVKTVHSGNAGNNLNYDAAQNDGLRIIAVGGFSLSRGLTLEGLCVSYFYRNSRMYDTLMQMGRWFGYREHYSDLCQIWMGQISMDWYEHISVATDELRREIKRMVNIGSTPKDFGLGVRSDERALLITSYNKMRYTQNIQIDVSLDGAVIETKSFSENNEINRNNIQTLNNWLKQLKEKGYDFVDNRNNELALSIPQMLNVPLESIITLLENINIHQANQSFNINNIISLLKKYEDDTVSLWDIAIATGSGDKQEFCGKNIASTVRKFYDKNNVIRLNQSRLGSTAHGLVGLTKNEKNTFEMEIKKNYPDDDSAKSFSQKDYFMTGLKRKPVLIVYPIQLSPQTKGSDGIFYDDELKQDIINIFDQPLVGFSIAIPSINGRQRVCCNYRVNRVWAKQYLDFEDDSEEEIDNTGAI